MESVLVLDVGYQPVSVAPWQSAIVWVLERIVEVVEESSDRQIRTPNWAVQMPSVVRFLRPIHRKRAIKFSRQNVYARDRGRCQYCGIRVARDDWTYDHVTPRTQGGITSWQNVVVSCVACNQRKGGRTPAQAKMVLLSMPVKPKKLPDTGFLALHYREGVHPAAWRDYLRDAVYWGGALEQD